MASLVTAELDRKTIKFIEKAKAKFGDKYDYSKVKYVHSGTKVTIICPIHGDFQILVGNHIEKAKAKGGCPKCGKMERCKKITLTTQNFIEKAKKKHGDKYDYSKTIYVNCETKVTIICPIHGEFQKCPSTHIRKSNEGGGCPTCGKMERIKKCTFTTQEFIEKAKKKHGDKYDYSKTIYVNGRTKVTIICPTHGDFQIFPNEHLKKNKLYGCQTCGKMIFIAKMTLTTQEFIEKAKKKHGDKYDYSKVKYVNCHTKVTIICTIHGDFQQSPSDHLKNHGCPYCINKTEGIILKFLLNNKCKLGITNDKVNRYTPYWCKNPDTNKDLPYDFYIELANGKKIIIECDGDQHYEYNPYFHNNCRENLESQIKRDIYKMNKAWDNDVSIIRILQDEVWYDRIDWKKELTDAINEIKNENEVTIKILGSLKDKLPWEVDSE
jgi:hypothetical protein